jgi:hypothetical protein
MVTSIFMFDGLEAEAVNVTGVFTLMPVVGECETETVSGIVETGTQMLFWQLEQLSVVDPQSVLSALQPPVYLTKVVESLQ